MKILGVSGIDGTVDFKRGRWPGFEDREYRISQENTTPRPALVVDGECVAARARLENHLLRKR